MKFPIIIKQSPLILVRRIIEIELVTAVGLFAISFIANYEEIYRTFFGNIFLRYDIFLFVVGALMQLFITVFIFFAWHAEEYRIKENEILHRKGIFFTKERSILLSSVLMVEYKKSFLEFLLNYGTISLSTVSSDKTFTIRSVEAAEIYANVIKNLIDKNGAKDEQLKNTLSILDLVLEGEHAKLEFKQTFRWDIKKNATNKDLEKAVIKTIAAFLNSSGGSLVIGVSDNGKITGLAQDYASLLRKDRDGFENHFNQVLKQLVGAEFRQYISVSFESIEEKDVCLIKVDPSPKPAYVSYNETEEFFIRTGNTTTALSVRETHSYIESHWQK